MTTIYFIRHAQADNSIRNGRERPLTPKGSADRNLVTDFLDGKNIDAVLSSPFKRAVDTIAPFAEKHHIPIRTIENFRERKSDSNMKKQDKNEDEFNSFVARQWADFTYALSDGESLAEVQARNINALEEVLREHPDQNIVIGTHATALSTIINFYDKTYGHAEYVAMVDILPWVVKMEFDGTSCCLIEKIDLFKGKIS